VSAARDHRYRVAMWIFIASETLLFAGLFALYAAYRGEYPDAFQAGVRHDVGWMGACNTLVLVVSSFFVAFAIAATRAGKRRETLLALGAVIALGLVFLALKLGEWAIHLSDGLGPGPAFASDAMPPGGALFFTLYFAMTGLHALHLCVGLCVIGWLFVLVQRRRIDRERHLLLELGGLYWHFVDVVWLFLWPCFYLLRE
jgi:cytochrome c oxidase subunit 3